MPLHMIKLCVGASSIGDLQNWVAERLQAAQAAGEPMEQFHQTRTMPKRRLDILAGGSLYWVIKGSVQVRQPILDLRAVTAADGIPRCRIVLDPVFVATEWHPRKAFQGWRYLEADAAPRDLGADSDIAALPTELKRELAQLGLI